MSDYPDHGYLEPGEAGDYTLEGSLDNISRRERSETSIPTRSTSGKGLQDAGQTFRKGTLDAELEYSEMVRRTLETRYILDNLEEAVKMENLFSENRLTTIVERALVYEEEGELKKRQGLIDSSPYSDRLEEKTDRLIENGVNGEKYVNRMVEDAEKAVDNYEKKIPGSLKGEGYNIANERLQEWYISNKIESYN